MENSEVQIVSHNQSAGLLSNSQNKVFTNIKPTTKEEQKKLFNLLSRCDGRVNDIVGQELVLKQYHFQEFGRKDRVTGEPRAAIRTIIVSDDGKSYVTLSTYFALQLKRLIDSMPDAVNDGIKIRIVKIHKDNAQGDILQFELVSEESTLDQTGSQEPVQA